MRALRGRLQHQKADRNAVVPPEQRLEFRIGINLGDIIVEDDDIQGDGVNIADRLQALAEPGGIAISGTAYDHVKAKLPVGFASLGEQKVKNIAEPVRVYRVMLDPAAAGKTIDRSDKAALGVFRAAAAIVAVRCLDLRPHGGNRGSRQPGPRPGCRCGYRYPALVGRAALRQI